MIEATSGIADDAEAVKKRNARESKRLYMIEYRKTEKWKVWQRQNQQATKDKRRANAYKWRKEHPEEWKQICEKSRLKNIEKIRERERARPRNLEKSAEAHKKWRAKNLEHATAKSKEWYAKNRESILKRAQEYVSENRDAVSARKAKYRQDNLHARREKEREWYVLNKERKAAKSKERYFSNPEVYRERARLRRLRDLEKIAARHKAWAKTPRGKAAIANSGHKRRALIKSTSTHPSNLQIEHLLSAAVACAYCCTMFSKKIKKTIDHVVPLAKGGAHSLSNLAIACPKCNSAKKDKLPSEFAKRIGVLFI